MTSKISNRDVRGSRPRRPAAAAAAGALLVLAAALLVAMAALQLGNGELRIPKVHVRVVTGADAAAKVILAVGFAVLARLTRRPGGGAAMGTWILGFLAAAYLSVGLAARATHASVRLILPGHNVLDTVNLEHDLHAVRPHWHDPVVTGLTMACLGGVLAAMALLASRTARRFARPSAGGEEGPIAAPVAAGRARVADRPPEPATAVDPWAAQDAAADARHPRPE